jgi:hypothetical protein
MTLSAPHFIGIGAARAGTTWVTDQLQRHPRIWIPRRKELHYFTRGLEYLSPSYLADSSPLRRLFGTAAHNIVYKRNLVRALGNDLLHPSWAQFRWDCRYYLGRVNDSWYGSLFEAQRDKVTGEITPAYSLLSQADAERLVEILPRVRIVHLMRHPSERAWSTIRYHEKRYGEKLTARSVDEVVAYLSNPAILLRSNYVKVLSRWQRLVPADRFFFAFFDEILEQPAALMSRLFHFLGVSPEEVRLDDEGMRGLVNPSFEKAMPEEVRLFLARQYIAEVEELSEMVGGYAERWRDDLRATLASGA